MMHPRAAELVRELELSPHPEGGFFREIHRSSLVLEGLPHGAPRAALTVIYFLLPGGSFSAWHAVRSDEAWHHLEGDAVRLHEIDARAGLHRSIDLGRDVLHGQRFQHVVRADDWQAAEVLGDAYALVGCSVAPGFDFADFSMPPRDEMLARFPAHEAIVRRLTR